MKLSDYFHTRPNISPEMSQEVSGVFMQLELPQQDSACSVLLNLAVLPAAQDVVPVILDIDVFDSARELNIDDRLWNRLDEFRRQKNKIFEACITDKVRELIS